MRIRAMLSASAMVCALSGASAAQDAGDGSKGHLKIDNPGQLDDAGIVEVYDKLTAQMVAGYGLSDIPFARNYRKWRAYNRLPFLSATHGNRYVNHYANPLVKRYGALGPGERYAKGAVFAKDSFTVTKGGKVYPGALFVMEKLAEGTSAGTGDWRYLMIMPDGSVFGDSAGETAAQVAYCHDCHRQKAQEDFVFFVPKAFRKPAE